MRASPDYPLPTPCRRLQEHKCCQNCYCYVCDGPAAECPEWTDNHCKASHLVAEWRQRRQQWKARREAATATAVAATGAATWTGRWSCDEIYQALQQVLPHLFTLPSVHLLLAIFY